MDLDNLEIWLTHNCPNYFNYATIPPLLIEGAAEPEPPLGKIIKLGFTGTRWGMTTPQHLVFINTILRLCPPRHSVGAIVAGQFFHGGCVGADIEANYRLAILRPDILRSVLPGKSSAGGENELEATYTEETEPFRIYPAAPFAKRNQSIVDASDVLIATPPDDALDSGWIDPTHGPKWKKRLKGGTGMTIQMGVRANKPVVVIDSNGNIHTYIPKVAK